MGRFRRTRRFARPPADATRVNEAIRARRITLVDEDGSRLGEFQPQDALVLARQRGLDLVEVAPNADPPVCRITDYGKLKYERKKKASEARRNAARPALKELKVRPKTDDHDLEVKIRRARSFLDRGDRVKVTVFFRGREHAHHGIGADQCLRIAAACASQGRIETSPRMEGRRMHMVLAPN